MNWPIILHHIASYSSNVRFGSYPLIWKSAKRTRNSRKKPKLQLTKGRCSLFPSTEQMKTIQYDSIIILNLNNYLKNFIFFNLSEIKKKIASLKKSIYLSIWQIITFRHVWSIVILNFLLHNILYSFITYMCIWSWSWFNYFPPPRALAVPPSSLVPAFIQISLCAPPQLTITRIVHNKSNTCFPHSGLGFKSTRNGFSTGSDPHLAMMISVRGRSLLSVRAFSIFRNMS